MSDNQMMRQIQEGTAVWEEDIVIPTYLTGEPDKNPMFFEKRVYQGSSGRVYPHPVIDKICDEKVDKTYHAVCLENPYLFVMILPELGGRIQRAYDKTNGYDFVYYNHVIKPALVGLTGPWISGGIEFNWPQHHRPSTFDPIDYKLRTEADGSAVAEVGEIENMFRTKGLTRFILYPDKAYLKIEVQLYNRTELPQTFLWWANPAVAVNDDTQSIFPPDVHAVMDHGKRAVSKFPIATGTYYKQDYSAGVDISRYKNIPVPTSYMAYHSDYDFVGGYDYGRKAGILHVADHHISPGKKQWTWGCGDFGKAWDRNLTDEDGPYIELMTGCFTDNQPDFTWLAPYEEKVFTQYFMPYKGVGMVKNASIRAAVGLESAGKDGAGEKNVEVAGAKVGNAKATGTKAERDSVFVRAYVTEPGPHCRLVLSRNGKELWEKELSLSPETSFEETVQLPDGDGMTGLSLSLFDQEGCLMVSYTEKASRIEEIPDPAKEPPVPEKAQTNEELLLYGRHIEQYRHATYLPEDYYLEGLKRDPSDARINHAYGLLMLRRGCLREAEAALRRAVKKAVLTNPNPYDGEALYDLGVCLKYQSRLDEAFDSFYKATWNGAVQAASWYQLAAIANLKGQQEEALSYIERALVYHAHNLKARTLKTALLRHMGRTEEALSCAEETLRVDDMDLAAQYELSRLGKQEAENSLSARLGSNDNWTIELALEYAAAGFYEDAFRVLKINADRKTAVYPLVHYYMAACAKAQKDGTGSREYLQKAAQDKSDYCFPHRLEDMLLLEWVLREQPEDAKAAWYLGNLWYDKRQYQAAVSCWEESIRYAPEFPTAHRNLAQAYFNQCGNPEGALQEMETAYALDQTDARVLLELDQLYKKTGKTPEFRRKKLEEHLDIAEKRDDLYLEYAALCNMAGEYEKALKLIESRKFHPWEGGEGKVPAQYTAALWGLARKKMQEKDGCAAEQYLRRALVYPENLGEGKLAGAQENHLYYALSEALSLQGKKKEAEEALLHASSGLSEPAGMMYYNDQPPETIFYQGLALLRLDRKDEANGRFNKLVDYGEAHLRDHVRIDYFAVSLPDLLIFNEDLDRRNRVHCLFMRGLGLFGKGEKGAALSCFDEALRLDINHAGVRLHRAFLADGSLNI